MSNPKHESKQKTHSTSTIAVLILILLILGLGGYLLYQIYFEKNDILSLFHLNQNETQEVNYALELENNPEPEPEKTVQIYQGNERPIAVMIDNSKDAFPQGGLNDAYLVYEIIVEGGESRLMALFKGTNPAKIGPVRSSRHYFIDYAMENDAIYAHFGWSPQAQSDIASFQINNINGLIESDEVYWRVKDKKSPHNVATTIEALKASAEKKNYRLTSEQKSVLHYVVDEVEIENGISAETITIPYSGKANTVKYEYDQNTKRYQRYDKGVKEHDWATEKPITTKNIIISFVRNYTLTDSENKGRQGIKNIGTLDGYYITNGKAIKIVCEKTSRGEQTVYKDLEGNEINVNDGNTFIQLCPIDAKVEIEGSEEIEESIETVEQNKDV